MKTILLIQKYSIAFLILVYPFISCFSQSKLQEAKKLKDNYDFAKAINIYNDYFSVNNFKIDDARDIAECYIMTGNTVDAEKWMSEVIAFNGYLLTDVLSYADILKSNSKFNEAIIQYQNYLKKQPSAKNKITELIKSCKNAKEWIANPDKYDITNVKTLNSSSSDFGLFSVGDGFIYTSDRKTNNGLFAENEIYGWTGKPYLKLYFAKKDNKGNPSSDPIAVKSLNNDYHNGPGCFDTLNSIIYFSRTQMIKVIKKPINSDPTSWYDNSSYKEYLNRIEIYSAKYINGTFENVKAFKYNNSELYSVGHPAISSDGKTLYFVSDMDGGYGGTDIYFCELQADGQWSKPKNAGPIINSSGKELFPTIDKKGTLYFSSDGHLGMGGLDIFFSKGSKDSWTVPQNLKYPLNSTKDDFSIYFTENNTGYFSSNRKGGIGDDDIYYFGATSTLIKKVVISGVAKEMLNDNTLSSLNGVNIKIENLTENNTEIVKTDKDGKFYYTANCNSSLVITGMMDGYYTQTKSLIAKCKTRNDTISNEMVFDKIILNKPIVIENIFYDYAKWDIKPESAIELDKIVKMMNDNPKISIEMSSHTDSRGTDQFNQILSQKRAASAAVYIISEGVNPSRVTAIGYGETKLLNRCKDGVECTEEEHAKNRRTEFMVIELEHSKN